jgi:hypothetical protein
VTRPFARFIAPIARQGHGAAHKAIERIAQIGQGKAIMQAPTEIFEAIALQKCLKVTYNKMVVTLAPHILYTRHDEMYIDAVTTDRDGRPPRELKLGTFKLAGLSDIQVLDETFEGMYGLYNEADDKYKGVTLFAIAPESAAA